MYSRDLHHYSLGLSCRVLSVSTKAKMVGNELILMLSLSQNEIKSRKKKSEGNYRRVKKNENCRLNKGKK